MRTGASMRVRRDDGEGFARREGSIKVGGKTDRKLTVKPRDWGYLPRSEIDIIDTSPI
jgi:hypothetical protein